MKIWGKRILLFACIALLSLMMGIRQGNTEEEVWLTGSLVEIKSASPLIGFATMPLSLATALVDAVPPKYLKETQEEGFNIPAISQSVKALKPNGVIDMTIKDMHLVIRKFTRPKPATPPAPYRLQINNPNLKLPIPLVLTGTAVTVLQYAVKEFKGMDSQLTQDRKSVV